LARNNPDEAQRCVLSDFDLVEIDRNYLAARAFVEAVANGHDSKVPLLAEICVGTVDDLIASAVDAERVAGQDALYMLAGMSERAGERKAAIEFYVRCIEGCFASPTVADHEVTLIRGARLALSRLGAPHPRVTISGPPQKSKFTIRHTLHNRLRFCANPFSKKSNS
jgi:hypothetical protein